MKKTLCICAACATLLLGVVGVSFALVSYAVTYLHEQLIQVDVECAECADCICFGKDGFVCRIYNSVADTSACSTD